MGWLDAWYGARNLLPFLHAQLSRSSIAYQMGPFSVSSRCEGVKGQENKLNKPRMLGQTLFFMLIRLGISFGLLCGYIHLFEGFLGWFL